MCQSEYIYHCNSKSTVGKLRARVEKLKYEDKNTKYFHPKASYGAKKNFISGLFHGKGGVMCWLGEYR